MPEFPRAFHLPHVICEAAIAHVAVQFGRLEQVLIPGASAAGPQQLLLDQSPDPRCRAVAEVLGSLGDREGPWRGHRARHQHTSCASRSCPVLACRRGSSPQLDDLAAPISGAVLSPVRSRVRRFQPEHSISLFVTMIEIWCSDQIMDSDSRPLIKIHATAAGTPRDAEAGVLHATDARPMTTPALAPGARSGRLTRTRAGASREREARDLNRYDNACANAARN